MTTVVCSPSTTPNRCGFASIQFSILSMKTTSGSPTLFRAHIVSHLEPDAIGVFPEFASSGMMPPRSKRMACGGYTYWSVRYRTAALQSSMPRRTALLMSDRTLIAIGLCTAGYDARQHRDFDVGRILALGVATELKKSPGNRSPGTMSAALGEEPRKQTMVSWRPLVQRGHSSTVIWTEIQKRGSRDQYPSDPDSGLNYAFGIRLRGWKPLSRLVHDPG